MLQAGHHRFSTTKRKPYHRKESAGSTIQTKDRSQNSQPINRLRLIQHCICAIQMVAGSPSVVVCQSLSNPVALGRVCTVSPHALHGLHCCRQNSMPTWCTRNVWLSMGHWGNSHWDSTGDGGDGWSPLSMCQANVWLSAHLLSPCLDQF